MSLKTKLQEAAVAVADLRRQLAEAERNYDALFKQATGGAKAKRILAKGSTVNNAPNAQVPVANFTDRLLALVMSNTGKEWSYGDIKKSLPDIPNTTIPSLLFRLQKNGKVTKAGRGKWKAVC